VQEEEEIGGADVVQISTDAGHSSTAYDSRVSVATRLRKYGGLAFRALADRDGDRQAILRRYLLIALAYHVRSDRAPTHDERAAWFRVAQGMTPAVAVDGRLGRYFVSPHDDVIGLSLFLSGGFDEAEMGRAVDFLRQYAGRSLSGRCFVDIGANVGTTTVQALLSYGASDVIAFEPAPDACDLLTATIAANGLCERVDARRIGLSDHAGLARMEASQWGSSQARNVTLNNWGDRRIQTSAAGESGRWPTIEVPIERLDTQGIDWARVSMVWMDVQGHEGHVLAGAPDLARSGVPVLSEYAPHLLRLSGGIDLFHEAASRYASIVDIRSGQVIPGPAVRDLAERFPDPSDYTDLLLLPE
jgi:FkbM family methyltransferase